MLLKPVVKELEIKVQHLGTFPGTSDEVVIIVTIRVSPSGSFRDEDFEQSFQVGALSRG